MEQQSTVNRNSLVPELYFLISKFLANGPLRETAKVLAQELERLNILPRRLDWTGQEHHQTLEELERKYPHIGTYHLVDLCSRIGPLLDKELAPSVPGVLSLLGAGRQSALRTRETVTRPRQLVDYCTRLHHMPLLDAIHRNNTHNIVKVLYGRESAGPIDRKLAIPTSFYSKQTLQRRTLGHLSAVYCVLFDRTGKYIITGADDLLVKLWSAIDGRLLATFRGASAEITDIAVNLDNSMLAAGSLDRILRVWDLQYGGPIAVLSGHTGMITSVNFCPSPKTDLRYLVTTSTDGSVAFWEYSTRNNKPNFNSKPVMYHEKLRPGQSQMICASFSPGGMFLAAGSADHHVRVYLMSEDGPKRILETESHSDTVDSIQWAHNGLRFISGSKDGTALVWHFETQQWKSNRLSMTERLPSCPAPSPEENTKPKVTMVSWDNTDDWVITAVNDFTIKVWNAHTCKLHKVLRGHTNEIYVLESHQKDSGVLLSAGHDGQLFIWDIVQGVSLANFLNHIDGQGDGGIFDAKWSPDGNMIAATDSHGHIIMFGYGTGHERLKQLPTELFFHTDYRPLIRDVSHHVMDEQTQTMPHLMPPPFLVDIDGNPYPPAMQRLVPGRENCPSDQLIPNIGMGVEQESVQEGAYSNIDRMIEALANRQGGPDGADQAPDSNNDRDNRNRNGFPEPNDPNRPNGRQQQGVLRYSAGNWHRDGSFKFHRRQYVRPMNHSNLQHLKQKIYAAGLQEHDQYRREMRRRPLMINTSNNVSSNQSNRRSGNRNDSSIRSARRSHANGGENGRQPAYRTRAVRENEPQPEAAPEQPTTSSSETTNSDDSTAIEEELDLSGSTSSDTDSSDYSDWVSHEPGRNLEPPKRSKRKHVQRRTYSPPEMDQPGPSTSRRQKVRKIPVSRDGEIPETFRPPEWLSEVIPRKAPYYPQMGDEVVYFRQGHARYLEAVRTKNVYQLGNKCEPWGSIELRDHEFCKIIGIKYEIRPPRLCCLKLALMNEDGVQTGRSFVIKYHDMPDVLDFLVLKQTFDTSVRRNWGPGDRFRCMIEDVWWLGQIESHNQLSAEFPNSLFMCFRVRWDNGEYEFMSPWDLEPVDESRLPQDVGGAIPVLPEELRATLYQPKTEEWPRGDRDATCRRIIGGLEQVMGLAIADMFIAPVDLNIYPEYAFVVEYPIDLNTIKARFENHFYRRITSAQFDVRYLATNAEKFNESHSNIVKHARIITDLCLRILSAANDVDVPAVYHQLVDTYMSSDSESETTQPGPSTSRPNNRNNRKPPAGSRRSRRLVPEGDWRVDCRELLEMIWQCDDSEPFREPVDTIQHPDYLQIVDTPMDLRTIKEDLLGGNYESPTDFAKDMKLIFQNSRNYNTNKRSRIFSMTLRLSTLFEAHIKPIIYNWKSARRRGKANAAKRGTGPSSNGAAKTRRDDRSRGASSSNRRNQTQTASRSSRNNNSDDEDDDDDEDDTPRKRPTRNGTMATRRAQSSSSNGVSSSSNTTSTDSQPGPSRPRVPAGASSATASSSRVTRRSQEDSGTMTSEETESSSDSTESSEDSTGVPVSHRRGYDSGETYTPHSRKKAKPKKSKKKAPSSAVSSSTAKKKSSKRAAPPTAAANPVSATENVIPGRQAQQQIQRQRNGNMAYAAVAGPSRVINRVEEQQREVREEDRRKEPENKPKNAASGGGGSSSSSGRTLRSARNNTGTDSDGDDAGEGSSNGRRPIKRHQKYESDHSYHISRPKSSRIVSDSDNEVESPRSTRGSTRRAQAEWGKSEDSLEPPEEREQQPTNSNLPNRRIRQRHRISDQEQSPEDTSNISRRAASQRTTNRTRNWRTSDSDHDPHAQLQSPDQPSTSSSARSRASTANGSSPSSVTKSPRKTENRSNYRRLRNVSHSEPSVTPPPHTVDHNYGEPSSRRTRNRHQLSRHQRNADELDNTPDDHTEEASDDDAPLRPRTTTGQISSRLRSKTTTSSAKRKRHSATSTDEVQEDSDEEFDADPTKTEDSDDEEATADSTDEDSDDNTPLKASSHTRSSRSQTASSKAAKPAPKSAANSRRTRQKERFSSDDDYGGPGPSSLRNTRNLKRPHYNEDSDEEDGNSRQRPKRVAIYANSAGSMQMNNQGPATSSSSARQHNGNVSNGEESDANSDDNEALTSVSSRGRVRRINPKARKIFRE